MNLSANLTICPAAVVSASHDYQPLPWSHEQDCVVMREDHGTRTVGEVRSMRCRWVYAWDCPLLMTVDDVEDDYILIRIWFLYFISVLILLSVYLKFLQLRLSGNTTGVLDSLM
jgi:hypothetical protein